MHPSNLTAFVKSQSEQASCHLRHSSLSSTDPCLKLKGYMLGRAMVSGTSSPLSIICLMPAWRSSSEDMVTARVRPRLLKMNLVLTPLPCAGTVLINVIVVWNLVKCLNEVLVPLPWSGTGLV